MHLRTPLVALLLLVPVAALAAELLSGDMPAVGAGVTIDDDLYVAGGTVRVEGTIRGDLLVAGGDVLVEGPVEGDVMAAGGTVRLEGPVRGSVRAAGGQLAIAAPIGEDLVVAGGRVDVGADARIGRDLVASGGRIELRAPVARDARIGSGEALIAGDVGGDVRADVGTLQVESVRIGGRLLHPENAEVEIDRTAVVRGGVVRTPAAAAGPERDRGPLGAILFALRLLVGLWAFGALFVLAAPGWSAAAVEAQRVRPGWAALGGLGILLVVPLLALLVLGIGLLVGGWWIGLVLLALWAIGVVLAVPVAALAVGRAIERRLGGRRLAWPLALLLGLLVLLVLFAIPFLGVLAALAAVVFGLGGLGLTLRRGPPPARPAG